MPLALGAGAHLGLRRRGGLRGGAGRRHQGLEQPGVVALLGVPLHAQAPPVTLHLERLHHLVRRPGRGEERARGPSWLTAWWWDAGTWAFSPSTPLSLLAGAICRSWVVILTGSGFWLSFPRRSGRCWVRVPPRATLRMYAAADGQGGKVGLDRRPGEDQLEPVPPVVGPIGLLVRRLVIQGGVDVTAAGQQQAAESGDQHGHGSRGHRRQDDRRPPSAIDGSGVARRRALPRESSYPTGRPQAPQ